MILEPQIIKVMRVFVIFEGFKFKACKKDAYEFIDIFFENYEDYIKINPRISPFSYMYKNNVKLHIHADGRKWLQKIGPE